MAHRSPAGEKIRSCTVITTDANDAVGVLHDRMPVIPAETDWPKWLGEEPATEDELRALLVPSPNERIKLWPVSKRVGNVRNDTPDLVDLVA
jgi:putative SOS response-associated peptidase YedK